MHFREFRAFPLDCRVQIIQNLLGSRFPTETILTGAVLSRGEARSISVWYARIVSLTSDNEVGLVSASLLFCLEVSWRVSWRRNDSLRVPASSEPFPRDPRAITALHQPDREVRVEQVMRRHAAAEEPGKFHCAISRDAQWLATRRPVPIAGGGVPARSGSPEGRVPTSPQPKMLKRNAGIMDGSTPESGPAAKRPAPGAGCATT